MHQMIQMNLGIQAKWAATVLTNKVWKKSYNAIILHERKDYL